VKKKIIFFFLFFFCFNSKSLENNILATVNDNSITLIDLQNEISFINFLNKESKINKNILKDEILKSLIERKIKEIEVNNYNLKIRDDEIDNKILYFSQKNNTTEYKIGNFFKSKNIPESYLKNIIIIEIKWEKLVFDIHKEKINKILLEAENQIVSETNQNELHQKQKKLEISISSLIEAYFNKIKRNYTIKVL